MRILIRRAVPICILLLVPLAPLGADTEPTIKDLATQVERVARDISVTAVLLQAFEGLGESRQAEEARQKIRDLIRRERDALDGLERRLDGEPEPAAADQEPEPEAPAEDELLLKITSYGKKELPIFSTDWLTKIIRDSRQKVMYREAAVGALLKRFEADFHSARIRTEQEKIGRALLPCLQDNDMGTRILVARLFRVFWPGQYLRSGYDPEESGYRERRKAIKMWQKYLRK